MIPVDSLLYKIDLKLNKLATNEHQQVPVENKIMALNEAQLKLVKQKSQKNSLRIQDDLQSLVVMHKPLDLTEADSKLNRYSASLESLDPRYMFYADSYFSASKGACKGRKIWINRDLASQGDLSLILNNSHYKPSFEYQETFNMISADEISVFSDGTFTPEVLYLSYIKYPLYIDKEGYEKFDGSLSTNQDSELADYLEDELVDLAVEYLAMYSENPMAVQSAQIRIQNNEP